MSIILILTKKEQLNRYFLALPLRLCLVCNGIKKFVEVALNMSTSTR